MATLDVNNFDQLRIGLEIIGALANTGEVGILGSLRQRQELQVIAEDF